MKKGLVVFLGLILIGVTTVGAFAQTSTSTTTTTSTTTSTSTNQQVVESLKALIEKLKQQLADLQAKVQALIQAREQVRQITQETKQTLGEIKDLRKGMSSEEIKAVQQILASDPSIYPEGLITGYFGPATEKALERFRERYQIREEVKDRIGEKTLEKIKELLQERREIKLENGRKCVITPPGLLIAPGQLKKGTSTLSIPECQVIPPGIQKLMKLRLGERGAGVPAPTSTNQTTTTNQTTSTENSQIQNQTNSTSTNE